MFLLVAVAVTTVLHLVVASRMARAAPSRAWAWAIWIGLSLLFSAVALAPLHWRFGAVIAPPRFEEAIHWVSAVAMGLYSFLVTFLVIQELGWLTASALDAARPGRVLLPADPERRRLLQHGLHLGVFGTTGGVAAIGYREARKLAQVKHVTVSVPNLHPDLANLRIAQITDLHVGPTIKRDYVQAVVDAINDLEVDLVAITGDLVDGPVAKLREDVAPLAELRSRYGTFFALGNHEYYSGWESWSAHLRELGMTVLMNERREVDRGGARLVIAGVLDHSSSGRVPGHGDDAAACLVGLEQADFRLLLAHQPRSCFRAAEAGFDLQVSGHTHGGQFFPWNLVVSLVQPFLAGLGRYRDLQVYVSRGTGYFGPPFRLGAPSEIALLELRPSERTGSEAVRA